MQVYKNYAVSDKGKMSRQRDTPTAANVVSYRNDQQTWPGTKDIRFGSRKGPRTLDSRLWSPKGLQIGRGEAFENEACLCAWVQHCKATDTDER